MTHYACLFQIDFFSENIQVFESFTIESNLLLHQNGTERFRGHSESDQERGVCVLNVSQTGDVSN